MTEEARRGRRSTEALRRHAPHTGGLRRFLLLGGIALTTLAMATSAAAMAPMAAPVNSAAHHRHHHHHRGKFQCEAWGAIIGGTSFAQANKPGKPCQNKHGRVNKAGRTVGALKLKVGGLTAVSQLKKWKVVRSGTSGNSSARTAKVSITLGGKKAIQIGVATSSASATCVGKGHKLSVKEKTASNVAYLVLGGKKTKIGNKYMKIPLGIATIYFNRVLKSGHTLIRRAVEIDLGGTKPTVILAQSRVGYTGRPCAT